MDCNSERDGCPQVILFFSVGTEMMWCEEHFQILSVMACMHTPVACLVHDIWQNLTYTYHFSSSYLTDLQGSISKEGNSNRKSRPIMCNRYVRHSSVSLLCPNGFLRFRLIILCTFTMHIDSDYEGRMPARYLRHGSQPECNAVRRAVVHYATCPSQVTLHIDFQQPR